MGYAHGKRWADGEVEESIMNMVNTLKLDHFPTKAEMIEFYGNRSLAGKVSKSGADITHQNLICVWLIPNRSLETSLKNLLLTRYLKIPDFLACIQMSNILMIC